MFIKERWSSNSNPKILLVANEYFSRGSWEISLIEFLGDEYDTFDFVICKNKYALLKHFGKAHACFLFGYNSVMTHYGNNKKLLYFPLIGLDFLNNKSIPPGFIIEKPPPYSAKAIAEYCLASSILITRNLQFALFSQKVRKWDQSGVLRETFSTISDKTIGVLGVGNVGNKVAEIFKKVNCNVLGCDKLIRSDSGFIDKWFSIDELSDFLRLSDIIIVTLPLTNETIGIIGKDELEFIGPDSYLINVSRGKIVNEKELVYALKKRIIKGAVLDVFSLEPLSIFSKFYKLNNIIITPHVAGNINLFIAEIQKDFINKTLKFLS